jgi:hypothetical protein
MGVCATLDIVEAMGMETLERSKANRSAAASIPAMARSRAEPCGSSPRIHMHLIDPASSTVL